MAHIEICFFNICMQSFLSPPSQMHLCHESSCIALSYMLLGVVENTMPLFKLPCQGYLYTIKGQACLSLTEWNFKNLVCCKNDNKTSAPECLIQLPLITSSYTTHSLCKDEDSISSLSLTSASHESAAPNSA